MVRYSGEFLAELWRQGLIRQDNETGEMIRTDTGEVVAHKRLNEFAIHYPAASRRKKYRMARTPNAARWDKLVGLVMSVVEAEKITRPVLSVSPAELFQRVTHKVKYGNQTHGEAIEKTLSLPPQQRLKKDIDFFKNKLLKERRRKKAQKHFR